jgi:hypothetical protein
MVSGMTGHGRSGAVAVMNFDSATGFGSDWDELISYPGTDTYSNFGFDVAIEGTAVGETCLLFRLYHFYAE